MELDTGDFVSLMGQVTYVRMFPNFELRPMDFTMQRTNNTLMYNICTLLI